MAGIWALSTALFGYLFGEIIGDFIGGWVTAEIGARTGVEEAWVRAFIAGWLLPAAVIAAVMWLTAIVVRWRADANAPSPRSARGPQAGRGKLGFVFGEHHPFTEHKRGAAGAVRRTLRVALANLGGTDLDDCHVYMEQITPGRELPGVPSERIHLHREGFPLRARGRKMIDVAAYDEALPDGSRADSIVVNMPEATFRDFFKVSAAKTHTLLLRATSADGVFAEATCRLFVENGRLRLVEL